uniref:Histidinol-phosphate aminotransferase n=1 Tax=candidate division WOR-3 bacterium TaxID=2052148 RepID=A0A7C4YCM1_UNCW3
MDFVREQVHKIKPYIPGKPIEELKREMGIEGEIIKLASNENPLGPSKLAMEAIKKAIKEVNFYPDDNVYYLKKKLSEKTGMPVENIIVGNGSVELIHLAIKAFLNPKEKLIMSKPSFIMGKIECSLFGGDVLEIETKEYSVDVEGLINAIDEKTKIVYIDNPNNPLGCMLSISEIDKIVGSLKNNTLLIIDEAYFEYIEREDYPDSLKYVKDGRNVLILRTFSKIYGLAGLRIGYGISNKEIIDYLSRVKLPFNVNNLAQVAAIAALDDVEHIEKSRKLIHEEKKFLYNEFKRLNIRYIPSEGNFITIVLNKDGMELYKALLKDGIIIRPLHQYDLNNLLRITIGTREQNKYLIRCIGKYI